MLRPRLSRSTPCCMATAQARAAEAEANTTISPSPRFLTSVPPASATAWRRTRSGPGGPRRRPRATGAGQLGRAHHVGEQDRHVLGGHAALHPPGVPQFVGDLEPGSFPSRSESSKPRQSPAQERGKGPVPGRRTRAIEESWSVRYMSSKMTRVQSALGTPSRSAVSSPR